VARLIVVNSGIFYAQLVEEDPSHGAGFGPRRVRPKKETSRIGSDRRKSADAMREIGNEMIASQRAWGCERNFGTLRAGSVGGIQLVRGIDQRLDAPASGRVLAVLRFRAAFSASACSFCLLSPSRGDAGDEIPLEGCLLGTFHRYVYGLMRMPLE
jgi:hypothetical protein